MTSNNRMVGRFLVARCRAFLLVFLLATVARLSILPVIADGCFVFKWDKKIDINEPTQKAVILYDAGREDMLLQVKYEGPLQEFGWLVPVPSVPKVERGSMDAFYELSELTQQHFGGGSQNGIIPMSLGRSEDSERPVKVIETKTVGAYEVAILSARDAGNLEHWLKANGYSIPNRKAEIVNDYIRRGWFFVAAKIQLNGRDGFRLVSSNPKDSLAATRTQASIQKKLASGELHPLLISFDTPQCIFPLKISAVGNKPSEVSLYVLSNQPLLNRPLFDESCKKLEQEWTKWQQSMAKHAGARERSEENLKVMALSFQLTPMVQGPAGIMQSRPDSQRNWTVEDLQAMVREGARPPAPPSIDDEFYASGDELVHPLHVETNQLTKSAKSMPRLRNKSWYLTKVNRTFSAAEMRDLEFQPAVPALAEVLPLPTGRSAALALAQFGTNGASGLFTACQSKDSTTRMNAAFGLEQVHDSRAVEPLLVLLADKMPGVRMHAARAAANNWDTRLVQPMEKLFRDPQQEVRDAAVVSLEAHEGRDQTPKYLNMANDSDTNVMMCALWMLLKLSPDLVPKEPLVRMLKDSNPNVQNLALHTLWRMNRDVVSRGDLLPLLNNPRTENIIVALKLIEGNGVVQPELPEPLASAREREERKRWLSSSEAAALATNRLSEARLMSLKILQRNADAKAVELTLPLLRDPNQIVRSRAFSAMKTLAGQNVSDTDAAKWEGWWSTNRTSLNRSSAIRK
jgi:HEAT repeat protein